jgi:hypothetical protein
VLPDVPGGRLRVRLQRDGRAGLQSRPCRAAAPTGEKSAGYDDENMPEKPSRDGSSGRSLREMAFQLSVSPAQPVKFAAPTTGLAGPAVPFTEPAPLCWAPATPPVLEWFPPELELFAWVPDCEATAPATFPELLADVEVDVDVEVLVELLVHVALPPWALRACTSTACLLPGQRTALCGWLFPGP